MMLAEELIAANEKELDGFANGAITAISPGLMQVLEDIKQEGVPYYQWTLLRPLLAAQVKVAVDRVRAQDSSIVEGSPAAANLEERISGTAAMLDGFENPPFTLQRLVEVILEPEKNYKTLPKFLNALEKLLAVTSTLQYVDPRAPPVPVEDVEPPRPPPTASDDVVAAPPAQASMQMDTVARAPWADGASSSGSI